MYIKKKDRELFQFIDNELKIPSRWLKFVNKQRVYHNLIIKKKDKYACTNCKHIFHSDKKVNEECKCPNCKNIYLVKSDRLKNYTFKDQLAIFDKVDNYYIERIFQLESHYHNGHINYYCFEWGRNIYDKYFSCLFQIMNDNTVGTASGYWLSYRANFNSNWKYTNSYYSPIAYYDEAVYYPYNLKRLFSDDPNYKYSQLWELVKHVGYCNLTYLLKNYNQSIEILTKMKLYKLALNPKTFLFKNTFEERFLGLSKDYLPFIRKYNLSLNELEVLSALKEKNINLIRMISKLDNFRDLSQIINFKKAFKLTDLNSDNCREYNDYLTMIKTMKFDMKNSRYIYPKHIKEAHDRVEREYEVVKDSIICEAIKTRHDELSKYAFSNNKYIIFPADSIESLEDESQQQCNCVRTYSERIAKGSCDIYFMRLVNNKSKSLVTVEVKNSEIVQKRTKNNHQTTLEQDKFLDMWERKILKGQ